MAARPTGQHAGARRTNKRGAFIERIWHCDCDPRLPADKFQVKNGGKNHGRWFYTCQKPQHKRCSFFLWSDEAKIREEAAVLSNSHFEPTCQPQTPKKLVANSMAVPPTPMSNKRSIDAPVSEAQNKKSGLSDPDESFDWSSSNDEDLLRAEQEVIMGRRLFETPSKVARTTSTTSPGKRAHDGSATSPEMSEQWPLSDDVFATPATSHFSSESALLSPSSTPSMLRSQADRHEVAEPSTLATEVLKILRGVHLKSEIENNLVDFLNRYDLRMQGIIKGRDITRLAMQAKDNKIAELQSRISTLEGERETNRTVISLLKSDIAASPKKPKGRNLPPPRRSEV